MPYILIIDTTNDLHTLGTFSRDITFVFVFGQILFTRAIMF